MTEDSIDRRFEKGEAHTGAENVIEVTDGSQARVALLYTCM